MTTLTCNDIAKFFLSQSDETVGDLISNLKLQKLVYYAQGFSLAILGEPLFNERIEHWTHGPVVPDLYNEYKQFGSNAINIPNLSFAKEAFTANQLELLNEVYQAYGQFSAWKLRNMTHEERPWLDTTDFQVIEHGAMKDYFLTLVN